MRFEWDEAKRLANIEKHGIDFVDLNRTRRHWYGTAACPNVAWFDLEPLFDGETVIILDDRFDYGEYRFVTLGLLNGIVFVVVHTETDEVIRIISARKATKYEEKRYFEEIAY